MNTAIDIDEIRRETRFRQLHRQGYGHYKAILEALDRAKESLCPHTDRGQILVAELAQSFNRLNAELVHRHAPLRLQLHTSSNRHRLSVTMTLEPALLEYCLDVNYDTGLDDPLGIRSLFGILRHYGIRRIGLVPFSQIEPKAIIDLSPEIYKRNFRLDNSPGMVLRSLIDRALWGGERIILPPELVATFNAINPERYDFLNEVGLMLMQSDDGNHFELFTPQPERHLQRAKRLRRLRQIAEAIRQRIERDDVGFYLLRQDADSTMAQRVFATIVQQQLLEDVIFCQYLADLHLRAYPQTDEGGQLSAIRFVAQDFDNSRHRTISEQDFPAGLLGIVNLAVRTCQNQVIPNRRDYLDFLQRPEVMAFLQQRAVSVVIPSQCRHRGVAEGETPYLYVENLIALK